MEDCTKCQRCSDDMKTRNRCCDCSYMVILEWEGWKRHCYLHDRFCEFLEEDGCDDFKQKKG
ncbi:MAG: hypothetical protein IJ759_00025 [Bacteroidales bacterium]|nr:hypothetical protein [Bacteroidales bacterium]